MLSFFPLGVLDGILNLIESVSEGFPSYSSINALCSLIFATFLYLGTRHCLDKVLLEGDILYNNVISGLKEQGLFQSKVLRAIPDKNQKILNGAGHSWSQIFMKLSEHVKVVTLSKHSTLFFSQHAWLPWQPDTNILAFRTAK